LAETASRLFFRNAINVGLPILLCDTSGIQDSDELEVDLTGGTVHNRTKGFTVTCSRIPQSMLRILEEGGLVEYIKRHGDFEF
ncbi:MAG: 3-isopropylmalate dehydratase, partial [Dehalococcoidia bacterium]|nr:3-isopropylmalate dehydratase [Dehalococcoidia bacterium]